MGMKFIWLWKLFVRHSVQFGQLKIQSNYCIVSNFVVFFKLTMSSSFYFITVLLLFCCFQYSAQNSPYFTNSFGLNSNWAQLGRTSTTGPTSLLESENPDPSELIKDTYQNIVKTTNILCMDCFSVIKP